MNRHPASMPPAGAHRYVTRVYYEDTDAGGVVYHATYLRMAERARTEAMRELGIAHADLTAQHGLFFVVRRVKLDYAAPARLDDALLVLTRPITLGSASIELRQSFFRHESAESEVANWPLVVAEVLLVCVGRSPGSEGDPSGAEFRPARIPDRWRAAMARLAAE